MASEVEIRVAERDKKIAAIQKLVLTGMRMIRDNAGQIHALTKAQRETDRQLRETDRIVRDLVRSLGRRDRSNGHGKRGEEVA